MAEAVPPPRQPRVFTIAPGQNFAGLVVRALTAGRLIDLPFAAEPHRLADLLIYVPTRRLCGILEAEFAAALDPRPAILPKIRPLADPGDPLEQFAGYDPGGSDPDLLVLTPQRAVSRMERRFLLLPLVDAWRRLIRPGEAPEKSGDPSVTLREQLMLADELGRLIDEMLISGLPLAALESTAPPGYDPAKYDVYWEKSRAFLRIAARYWPEALEEAGARDEMDLRLEAIETEAARLERGESGPVLVIGSTGSVAATARLMRAVARLEHGAVVLPGLDQTLDERGWREIGDDAATLATRFAHPQAALKRLLAVLGVARQDVRPVSPEEPAPAQRNRMLSEALRPAESIDLWRASAAAADLPAAMEGVAVIEAAEEHEEALAVAVLMRETLEAPEARVAFVTANRGLALRVRAALRRWHIEVEDSAGASLAATPAGTFLQLFLHAAGERGGGAILALLRHPLARFGFPAGSFPALVDALEVLVFRGRHFSSAQSLEDRVRHALAAAPDHPHPAAARIPEAQRAGLPVLAKVLDDLFRPFLAGAPAHPLAAFTRDIALTLRRAGEDDAGRSALDGEASAPALMNLLDEIGTHGTSCAVAPDGLAGAFDLLLREKVLPPRSGHPRAAILGQLESRLVFVDRLIVGGLNEGSFPPAVQEGPFLNRAMRIDLGLQPPDRRIGQSAHDFAMLAGNRDLVLTRARREGEQPSMASRFLRRLSAYVGEQHWRAALARGEETLALARRLDTPDALIALEPPAPVPAAPRVPERLSITEIETLRRDPYAIYARHILRLVPLEPIDPALDARERGTVLHACLEDYAAGDPPADPERAREHLLAIGERRFAAIRQERELYHFWWRRFLGIVDDFIAFDRARRDAGWRVLAELAGRVALPLPSGDVMAISGKVDRLEISASGSLAIFDYKSGAAPSGAAVGSGLAPQLPISAALAQHGAFRSVPPDAAIAELGYVLIGGTDPFETRTIDPGKARAGSLDELAARNWQALTEELDALAAGRAAYVSRKAPRAQAREGDYDHLARVREWQSLGADEGEAAGGEAE